MDERVAQAVVNLDDPELVLDLRRMNDKAQSSHFDAFWDELQAYLDEINLAVYERRHGDTLHMPFTTSLWHLQEIDFARNFLRNASQYHVWSGFASSSGHATNTMLWL